MKPGIRPGDPRAKTAARLGGQRSGEARQAQRARRWETLGIDPVVAADIRRQGYAAGFKTGFRKGQASR